jgi:hypothetical protein
MNITICIDSLIFEGVELPAGKRSAVRVAVETELGRLLSAGGLMPQLLSGGMLPRVSAPSILLNPAHSPAEMGGQIARAIYGGIGK